MKNMLSFLVIALYSAVFVFPLPVAAQDAELARIQSNIKGIENYYQWFVSTESIQTSTKNDYFDQQQYSKGIFSFMKQFYSWYGQLKDDKGKLIISHTKPGETFENSYIGWKNECGVAADFVGKDGNSYLDAAKKLEELAKSENLTTSSRRTMADYSDTLVAEALTVVRTPSCIYVLANFLASLDNYNVECIAKKFIAPNRTVEATTRAEFERIDKGCGDHPDVSETLVKWQPIPGCVGGFQCEVAVPIDKDANKYYPWKGGSSTEARTWAAFKKKTKENLTNAYKKLEEFKGTSAKDTQAATDRAQEELKKGSVVGLTLPLSDISIPVLIGRVINQILGIVGALGLVGFVYGGIMYMSAGGNPERAEKGRKAIVWSTLGMVVIFSAYAIVKFIQDAIVK